MKTRTLLQTLVIGVGFGMMGQAQAAGNCTIMLNNLMTWAKSNTDAWKNNVLGVTMTSNVHNRKFASYTVGTLEYQPGFSRGLVFFPEKLVGEAQTYFSDRQWDHSPPCTSGSFCITDMQPFSPDKRDKVKIALSKNLADATKANVSLTLLSWGNAKVNFQAQCDNGHIYGFNKDQHGTHLFDLTFTKDQETILH